MLSEYRSCLMGIAILGVILAHSAVWAGNPLDLVCIVDPFARLVFTEGFLFLSGLGLYYSFTKKQDLKTYYKKRVLRLFIPFMLIALPFYLIQFVEGQDDIGMFILKETAFYFYIYGNNGMWYISISLLLYLIFPLLYRFVFANISNTRIYFFRTLFLIGVAIGFNYVLMYGCNDYYLKVAIGINKIPMFIIGMYIGYMSYNNVINSFSKVMIICLIIALLLYICKTKILSLVCYSEQMIRICCMFSLSFTFSKLNQLLKKPIGLMEWFGKYTLELYVFHMLNYNLLRHVIYEWINVSSNSNIDVAIVLVNLILSISLAKRINQFVNFVTKKI